jgi:DNA-binding SARP family transcriptional activator
VLRLSVLGDVGVTVDGVRYPVDAPRQRALLAILAFAANRAVNAASLIDDIWGENLPVHPDAALQVLVSRLRTALGPAAGRVVSDAGAYRLDVGNDELDLAAAMEQLLCARSWLQQNEAEQAVREVDLTLARWSADPLRYLEPFPCYARAADGARDLWVALSSLRIDALLAAGRHVEVLSQITAWIADAPWDEHRRTQHMLALYLGGRQVDALRAYDEFRALLIEQLGIEPTADLRNLHRRMLHHDASLVPRRARVVSTLPPWTSVRLPFMGRSAEEEQLIGCLRDVAAGGRRLILVEGEPGIGKTRLVLEVARRVQDDHVVLAATGSDARKSVVSAIADALVDVLLQLDDEELRLCLGRWPADLASVAPALRVRLPDLGPPLQGDVRLRAEQVRRALVSCLTALSRRTPILLVLDDLHRAGPDLLMLLGALMKAPAEPRIGVLATARMSSPDRSSRLAHLIASLEPDNVVERVILGGLDVTSVTRLLAERRIADDGGTAAALHALTDGQPFFLGEMLDSGEVAGGSLDHLPTRVLDFVRYRIRALGPVEETVLADSSAFFTSFDVALVAAVSDASAATAAEVIARCVDAHILRPIGLRDYTFAHEVTRRALAETLDDDRRAGVHRRIAIEYEARDEPPALIASHWRHAAGADAEAKTVIYADRAGEADMARHDPAAAGRWFGIASDLETAPARRGRLLVRLADAQRLAGDPAAPGTLRGAIDIARASGDDDLLIKCATGWTPTWSSGLPFEWDERVQLLEGAAAAAVSDRDRALLLGRLATEMLYSDDGDRAAPLAADALVHAGHSGDRRTCIEVHLRHFDATWAPHFLEARRAAMAEVLTLAGDADVVDRCFTLSRAIAAAIEAVEVAAADATLAELCALSARHDLSIVTHAVTAVRAWRTGLAGDLREAERLVTEAGRLAESTQLHNASYGTALQLLCLQWSRGRFADLLPVLELGDANARARVSGRIMMSRALAASGRRDEARCLLGTVTEPELESLPKDALWSTVLIVAAEAAYMVDAADVARVVHRLLVPFASRIAFARSWAVAPIALGAALAGACAGTPDADELFEEAVDICVRVDAPVLRARSEVAWVWSSLRRSTVGRDRARTSARIEEARIVFDDRGLDALGASARELAVRVGS